MTKSISHEVYILGMWEDDLQTNNKKIFSNDKCNDENKTQWYEKKWLLGPGLEVTAE